ncbi:hypothetical protein Desaci_0846 [Desulfosporosinus acidiphilus SJ4]|uniref:Uncharacterized protein n=1 Tax=Desulfosporosinus acidiphilus (strain DSM 22704 / JCM 16185 / SJ4) TaxID=646529 RepID=I4D278_DESAJ|nr:hypothetical protein [Desulfosporosinus acidiphilus]AFM39902.1 hypothetical protein Desaci_0846 [Desulfosporosinus acidiphilus SJ4]
MTSNTILIIAAIVIGVIVAAKFIRFIVKGILLLVVLAVVLLIFLNISQGNLLKNSTVSNTKIESSVQSGLSNITQKFKSLDYEQTVTNLQTMLTKGIDYGKQALAKIGH